MNTTPTYTAYLGHLDRRTPARPYKVPKFLRGCTPLVTPANMPADPGYGLADTAANVRKLLQQLCTTPTDKKAVTVVALPHSTPAHVHIDRTLASARYRITVPASWHHKALDMLGEWGFIAVAAGWTDRRQNDDDIWMEIYKIKD